MGVSKGTDNFRESRLVSQDANCKKILVELQKAEKRKASYSGINEIAKDVGERTGIHRTTLKRNAVYLSMLAQHLRQHVGYVATPHDSDPLVLRKAKLIDGEIEIGKLLHKIERLEADLYLAKHALKDQAQASLPGTEVIQAKFFDTAMVLKKVLDQINSQGEIYEIDLEKGALRDLSAAPGKQEFVDTKRLKPFFEVLQRLKAQGGN